MAHLSLEGVGQPGDRDRGLLVELAFARGGIVLQPSFIVGTDLMRGTLVPLLQEWKGVELTLYAVYLSQRRLSPRVRAFIDHVVESVGKEPYWENRKPMPTRKRRTRAANP